MATVRAVVALGHGLRKQHQLKVRRPLKSVTVITQRRGGIARRSRTTRDLIMDELNVREVWWSRRAKGWSSSVPKPTFGDWALGWVRGWARWRPPSAT